MQCIIDLKDNVLRMGGGEVSVPFLPGFILCLQVIESHLFNVCWKDFIIYLNCFLLSYSVLESFHHFVWQSLYSLSTECLIYCQLV